MKVYCKGQEAEVLGVKFERRLFSEYIVSINLLTILSFVIYLTLSRITEGKIVNEFESNKSSPMNYSLKLVGLPHNFSEQETIKNLYIHFQTFWINKGNKIEDFPVLDICVA